MYIKKLHILILLITVFTIGCYSDINNQKTSMPNNAVKEKSVIPDDQTKFLEMVKTCQKALTELELTNNEIKIDELYKVYYDALNSFKGLVLKDWVGTVKKVDKQSFLGTITYSVYCYSEGIEFKLIPNNNEDSFSNSPLPIFMELKAGDKIVFEGIFDREISLTNKGGLSDPSFHIKPIISIKKI